VLTNIGMSAEHPAPPLLSAIRGAGLFCVYLPLVTGSRILVSRYFSLVCNDSRMMEYMLLAYLDESEYKTSHYYMGTLLVTPDQIQLIEDGFDRLTAMVAREVKDFDPDTELHGYPVFQGTEEWKDVPPALRARVSVTALKIIADSKAQYVSRCINVDQQRTLYRNPYPAHQLAFGYSLESIQRINNNDFRGKKRILVLADQHHTAEDSRTRIKSLKHTVERGRNSVKLNSIIDTVYFGPSRYSRLLQASDMATYFFKRLRHNKERHPKAIKSMRKIAEHLNSITRFHHEFP